MIGGRRMMMGRGGQPLTRLLVNFDNASMPPADERGGIYTVVDAGQSLTATDPKFGTRCLLNGGGYGYFTPGPGVSFDSSPGEAWCLEVWCKAVMDGSDAGSGMLGVVGADGQFPPESGVSLWSYNYGLTSGMDASNAFSTEALTGEWDHCAVYWIGAGLYVALNGVVTAAGAGYDLTGCERIIIGRDLVVGSGGSWNGRLDCARYSVGSSRYGASNFTPPAAPFVLD